LRGRGKLVWLAGILILLIAAILIWFSVPYSPMMTEFEQLKTKQNANLPDSNQVFTAEDIAGLPLPLQRYFEYCGFLGKPKMPNMKIEHNNVDFILNSKKLKIQCTQYNSALKPERIALIKTHLYGIPFEGLDAYQNGIGSMKGVFAKNITLFNQKGAAMNQSSLVNCLAESLLVPEMALQNFMTWETINDHQVRGTISYYGLSVTGIFSFDKNGLLEQFTTEDRVYVDTAGNEKRIKWSAVCDNYREINGIKQPKTLKAIWHLPEGDLVYFDGNDTVIQYNESK